MCNANLSDTSLNKIFAFLKAQKGIYVVRYEACRQFVEAVLWIRRVVRSGDCYRETEANGTVCTSVFEERVIKEFGLSCMGTKPMTLIWKVL
jgi:hypothetical protein